MESRRSCSAAHVLKMRYVLFVNGPAGDDAHRVGVLVGDDTVADVTAALLDEGLNVTSMRKFLELGARGAAAAAKAVKEAVYHRARSAVRLRAPIYDP